MRRGKEHEIQDRLKALEYWERTCEGRADCQGCPYDDMTVKCLDIEAAVVKLTVAYREIMSMTQFINVLIDRIEDDEDDYDDELDDYDDELDW